MPTVHVEAGSSADLQEIADSLFKAKKVVVITGAGISTNSGIPVSLLRSPRGCWLPNVRIFNDVIRISVQNMACMQ